MAGGQYTLNITFISQTLYLNSGWTCAKVLAAGDLTTYPTQVYQINKVLLPEAIFGTNIPPPPPPPSSTPGTSPSSSTTSTPSAPPPPPPPTATTATPATSTPSAPPPPPTTSTPTTTIYNYCTFSGFSSDRRFGWLDWDCFRSFRWDTTVVVGEYDADRIATAYLESFCGRLHQIRKSVLSGMIILLEDSFIL
ncbi:hypothetical protein RHGRI_009908 [Rhododendron griersonianum]|uniref:Uncharacterized protein n=1 Tax=Rhododendron griersonianum TaxID=479676 RepID=A0AAV6KGG8_9ERIC|nr:hypothetical protein RHGRI_009908 [Rhododendron griersonianum]